MNTIENRLEQIEKDIQNSSISNAAINAKMNFLIGAVLGKTIGKIDLDAIKKEREAVEAEAIKMEESAAARREIYKEENECFFGVTEIFKNCYHHLVLFGNLDNFKITEEDALDIVHCKKTLEAVLDDKILDYPAEVREKVISGLRGHLGDDFFKIVDKDKAENEKRKEEMREMPDENDLSFIEELGIEDEEDEEEETEWETEVENDRL